MGRQSCRRPPGTIRSMKQTNLMKHSGSQVVPGLRGRHGEPWNQKMQMRPRISKYHPSHGCDFDFFFLSPISDQQKCDSISSPFLPISPTPPSSSPPNFHLPDDIYCSNNIPSKEKIRLLSWNVRSLTTKFKDVKQLILETNPDVVCLQEIWNIDKKIDISIPGFHSPFIKQRAKKGEGDALHT